MGALRGAGRRRSVLPARRARLSPDALRRDLQGLAGDVYGEMVVVGGQGEEVRAGLVDDGAVGEDGVGAHEDGLRPGHEGAPAGAPGVNVTAPPAAPSPWASRRPSKRGPPSQTMTRLSPAASAVRE